MPNKINKKGQEAYVDLAIGIIIIVLTIAITIFFSLKGTDQAKQNYITHLEKHRTTENMVSQLTSIGPNYLIEENFDEKLFEKIFSENNKNFCPYFDCNIIVKLDEEKIFERKEITDPTSLRFMTANYYLPTNNKPITIELTETILGIETQISIINHVI